MPDINNNYKNTKNTFEIKNGVALMTILKKDGTELIAKIDEADLEKVQSAGTWFAEWHKDFNSYLVQNISSSKPKMFLIHFHLAQVSSRSGLPALALKHDS